MAQARRGAGLIAREARASALAPALTLAFGLGAAACAPGPVDTDALAARHPTLADVDGHHLDQTTPYLLAHGGTLTAFTCRWETPATIPVALPPDATPDEVRALEAALRGWESAGLGLRFERVPPGKERLTVAFADDSVTTTKGQGVGRSVTDCRLEGLEPRGGVLPAAISGAAVEIARRTPQDFRGRDRALAPEALAGIALHEIGHALGFQGHVSHGDTAMILSRDDVAWRGKALLRGERVSDATLRALYALPSGTVIRQVPVPAARTDPVDRLAAIAAEMELRGPWVRVGDRDGRVFWRDARSDEYGVTLADARRVIEEPSRLVLLPEPAAAALLRGLAAAPD